MKLPSSDVPHSAVTGLTPRVDESARIRVLESFDADGLEDDPELRAIAEFAAKLCNVPIAQVTLVEEVRQRFLAGQGMDVKETPRDVSFCAHAMLRKNILEVPDATQDPRFAQNPLVTRGHGIRFYAGQPLVSIEEGMPLGALCVVDTHPHPEGLDDFQREGLAVLGQAVMRRLRARRESLSAARQLDESESRFKALADAIPDIAWSTDETGKMEYFNSRWYEYVGAPPGTFPENRAEFIHPDDLSETLRLWDHSLQTGEAFEKEMRLLRHDGVYRWMLARAVPVLQADGHVTKWFGTSTDVHEVHTLSESRDLLGKELAHRIKNIFAVVSGLVSLHARRTPEHKQFADELIQTLQALGRAHDFVRPSSGVIQGESLQGLLGVIFRPYRDAGRARIVVSGDDMDISARVATPLALIFHELATNAAKYGALAEQDGEVEVTVSDEGEALRLLWAENGTDTAARAQDAFETSGFGTRLIDMSVKGQLQGSWDRRFEDAGLVVELTVAKEAIRP